jgi:hypothetical protein
MIEIRSYFASNFPPNKKPSQSLRTMRAAPCFFTLQAVPACLVPRRHSRSLVPGRSSGSRIILLPHLPIRQAAEKVYLLRSQSLGNPHVQRQYALVSLVPAASHLELFEQP